MSLDKPHTSHSNKEWKKQNCANNEKTIQERNHIVHDCKTQSEDLKSTVTVNAKKLIEINTLWLPQTLKIDKNWAIIGKRTNTVYGKIDIETFNRKIREDEFGEKIFTDKNSTYTANETWFWKIEWSSWACSFPIKWESSILLSNWNLYIRTNSGFEKIDLWWNKFTDKSKILSFWEGSSGLDLEAITFDWKSVFIYRSLKLSKFPYEVWEIRFKKINWEFPENWSNWTENFLVIKKWKEIIIYNFEDGQYYNFQKFVDEKTRNGSASWTKKLEKFIKNQAPSIFREWDYK